MAASIVDGGVKQRHPPASAQPQPPPTKEKHANGRPKLTSRTSSHHPAGKVKHGALMQFLRMCAFAAYFNGSILACVNLHHSHLQPAR